MSELYLDNAATSWPKPEEVYSGLEHFMRACGGTPARGKHPRAAEAGRILAECRRRLQRLLRAEEGYRLIFTSGATEALNLALKGWVRARGHVVVTELEHNSVFRPLSSLRRERGATWTVVPAGADGRIDPDDVERALRPDTCLVAVTHASNVLGVRVDIEAIAQAARARGVHVLVDAAQTVGVHPANFAAARIDMVAFTGHKSLLGPPGTGGLLLRDGMDLKPLKEGGTGTFSLEPEQPEGFPERYESGSPNMYGIAGLLGAVGYLERVSVEAVGAKKRCFADRLRKGLSALRGVRVYGCPDPARGTGIVAFNVGDLPSERVGEALWERSGIMVRAGHHCAPFVHGRLGTREQGVVRAGIGFLTREADLDALVGAVRELT